MNRLKTLALVALLAALPAAAGPGDASSDPACCQLTTSLAQDTLRGNDVLGDERFFTQEGAPPNIHFLFDNSGSMRELPQNDWLTSGDKCNIEALDTYLAANGWNPAVLYPPPDMGTKIGADDGFPDLFQNTKVYKYRSWEDSSVPKPSYDTAADACLDQHSGSESRRSECMTCLATKGYYRRPFSSWTWNAYSPVDGLIFTGNHLNFNPPKYVAARAVIKDVIKDLRRVRAGMTVFAADNDGGHQLLPQNPTCDQIIKDSASWDSNRAKYINGINGLSFGTGTPLAETLLNVGQLFSSQDSIYNTKLGSGWTEPAFTNNTSLKTGNRSWCWGCQVSSVIIITDGLPSVDSDVPVSRLRTLNGGAVICPDWDADGSPDCGDGADEKLDDVAKFLATQDLQATSPVVIGDLNTGGKQSLTIYGVGFGVKSPILRNAAEVGGGAYYEATDAYSLKKALTEIIANVEKRATSFAASSVASLQLDRTTGSLVPRFKPSSKGLPWSGFLYRFELTSEFSLNCVDKDAAAAKLAGTKYDLDANADGDCRDTVMVDRNSNYIFEDDEGLFRLIKDDTVLAEPYWEASDVLLKSGGTARTAWMRRKIWTVIDGNGDNKLDSKDTPVEFKEENAALLMPYLGIPTSGTLPTECAAIGARHGTTLTPLDCAKWVIRYFRGADILNADPTKRLQDQPNLLRDIFHSSPLSVDPPHSREMSKFVMGQTLPSLFMTPTDLAGYPANLDELPAGRAGPDGNWDAYDEFLMRRRVRNRIVLVGSNGGLLHAFDNGANTYKGSDVHFDRFNAGTGEELWAFVPPDMLPKLKQNIDRHGYFVDNSPMVRDVWLDGVGGLDAVKDGLKQWSEFRTVVIMGGGMGGSHRFALDLTDVIPSGGTSRPPNQRGDFLWLWPQPCDTLAHKVGEAFSNYSPKPPPIGPVAIADEAGPFKIAEKNAREQWVVMFNGGYDRYLVRGRGFAMVDIATGDTLWDYFHGDASQPRTDQLTHPVAAGIAMLDLGMQDVGATRENDLLFDTMNVADLGGTQWVARFWEPGIVDGSTGKVTNWTAARSFKVQASSESRVRPSFSYISSNSWGPENRVYTFIGTGDRYNMMDTKMACRLSNPLACAQQGCNVTLNVTQQRGATQSFRGAIQYTGFNLTTAGTTTSIATGGNACQLARSTAAWNISSANACSANASGSLSYECSGTTAWACGPKADTWSTFGTVPTDVNMSLNRRFYGFRFWGQGDTEKLTFNTPTEAAAFDAARINESSLRDNSTGLAGEDATKRGWYASYIGEERTGSTATVIRGIVVWNSFIPNYLPGAICATAGANEARMYGAKAFSGDLPRGFEYFNTAAHRLNTATCATSTTAIDRTGGTRCDDEDGALTLGGIQGETARYVERKAVASPGDPTVQYTIANGQGALAVVTIEPGAVTGASVERGLDLVQNIYSLEVTPEEHTCRHVPDNQACK